jgi:protein-disulfide isomerase
VTRLGRGPATIGPPDVIVKERCVSGSRLWTSAALAILTCCMSAAGLAQSRQTGPPPNVRLTDLTGNSLGRPNAPLTMVEFTDLQCPICRQFHLAAFDQLKINYIDTGKLRFISRDFPVERAHPLALRAAVATHCAGYQGKFWEMRDTVLTNNPHLTPEIFSTFAEELKLDGTAFAACVANPTRALSEVQSGLADAKSVGVYATPSFLFGRTTANGIEGPLMSGAPTYEILDRKLKQVLATPAPK